MHIEHSLLALLLVLKSSLLVEFCKIEFEVSGVFNIPVLREELNLCSVE